jgi:DHA2 family multidrug resistance protein
VIIQKEYRNKNVRNFDLIGFISASIFLPLILYALTEGNATTNAEGWSASYVLICFGISAIALAVFITAELTVKEPLIDLRLLINHNFGIANIVMFIFGMGMFGSTFLLPLYLQNSLGYTAIQAGAVFLPVGIIQGTMAPISGLMSGRINPKIPIIIGIALLALSFYLNSSFSFLTEHSYISTILYFRGFAMGILFTPLSSISLSEISRDHMAQASGLFNIIRQLGGSFGVAVLATLLTTRVNYHSQMYGQSIESISPAYQKVATNLSYQFQHNAGSSSTTASKQSQAIIVAQVNKEAFIQGVDDDFIVASIITILGIIPILLLHAKKKHSSLKPLTNE